AEQAVYQGDKQLAELGEQIDESAKADVTKALDELRAVVESSDVDDIKAKTAALESAFHKVSEQVYANAQAQQQSAPGDAGTGGANGGDPEEEIVDAEVVEDES
ncbi:MAG: Hsp70 family protein, partial [Solirubrobacterales bacterium]